jgi:hypothetical protein
MINIASQHDGVGITQGLDWAINRPDLGGHEGKRVSLPRICPET